MAEYFFPLSRGAVVTSGFGPRWGTTHWGTDYGRPGGCAGDAVYAPQAGKVIMAGPASGFGGPDPAGWLVIDHPDHAGGGVTVLGHIIREVNVGDHVRAGQRVARVNPHAATNGGVAPHVHLEHHLRVWSPPGPERVDPHAWLAARGAVWPVDINSKEETPMATVIDTAARPPSPAAIRAAGHVGHVVYISPDRTGGSLPGKPVSREHVDAMKKEGLGIACVWQFGKDSSAAPPDVRRGYDGGVADARAADKKLRELGLSNWPVFFAVDFDISLDEWNRVAVTYFRGAGSVLGRARVGIYGHSRVCDWAREDGVIADLGGGKHLMWQTRSWSRGVIHKGAVLYQRIIDVPSSPGPRIDGVAVDVNDVLHSDWGQKPRDAAAPAPAPPPPKEKPLGTQFQADVTMLTTVDRGKRDPSRVPHITLHTYECPREAGVAALRRRAGWQQDSRTGSYTMLIAADGAILRANDDDYTPCASLPTGDVNGFHLSFLGYARDSRAEWLKYPEQLRAAARIGADYIRRYGHEPRHLTVAEVRARKAKGFATHDDVSKAFRESTHTDPGPNFPWDVFLDMVHQELREPGRGEPRPGGTPPVPPETPKENHVLTEPRYPSLINPAVKLRPIDAIMLTDAALWRVEAKLDALLDALGMDPVAIADEAIAADRAKTDNPAA